MHEDVEALTVKDGVRPSMMLTYPKGSEFREMHHLTRMIHVGLINRPEKIHFGSHVQMPKYVCARGGGGSRLH